jgi:Uncharacterized conserved protein
MKKFISVLSFVLVIIGALNWGLWGFFQFDLVAWLFGGNTAGLSRLVYSVVGLAGLWILGTFGKCVKAMCCKKESSCDSNCDKDQ